MHPTRPVLALAPLLALPFLLPAPPSAPAPPAAARYEIDPVHSSLVFRIRHLGVGYVYGRFGEIAGSFALDEADPSASSVRITVPAASVDTNSEKRDAHLRSPDFFSAKEFPEITFESTAVERRADGTWVVTGELALHGTTREIEVEVDKVGEGPDPWGGHRAGFETVFEIDPVDFGMRYLQNTDALGPGTRVILAVEGVLADEGTSR